MAAKKAAQIPAMKPKMGNRWRVMSRESRLSRAMPARTTLPVRAPAKTRPWATKRNASRKPPVKLRRSAAEGDCAVRLSGVEVGGLVMGGGTDVSLDAGWDARCASTGYECN